MSDLLNKLNWVVDDSDSTHPLKGIAMRAIKAIECRDNKIAQLEQEVKELKVHVEHQSKELDAMYDFAIDCGICPELMRVNFANTHTPKQSLAQHDKDTRSQLIFEIGSLVNDESRIQGLAENVILSILTNLLAEQLQEQE